MLRAINPGDAEYASVMLEAQVEFDEWERGKRKNRKADKAKFKAMRLAKIEAAKEFGDEDEDE